jgi:hypothetical protein
MLIIALPWCLCVDVFPCKQWTSCGSRQFLGCGLEESEALPVGWEHEERNDNQNSWSSVLDFTASGLRYMID